MNEVTKLYENAEPNRDCNLYKHFTECPMKHTQCEDCENFVYPPFTAEKQLELIKWLGELDMLEIMRTTREDKAWIINSEYGMSGNVYKHTSRMKSFEEAIASLINSLWQDLTDTERTQIKEILSE